MNCSIILLLLIIVALIEHNSTFYFHNGLVYNGEKLNSTEYPFVMYIELHNKTSKNYTSCTGTLVKKLFVLTAGHCCFNFSATEIQICQGSPLVRKRADYHKVVKIYIHKEFKMSNLINDICVLKLEKGAFPNIKKFSKIGGSPKDFRNGNKLNCTLIGFGLTGNKKRNGDTGYTMTNDIIHDETTCINGIESLWHQRLCVVPFGKSKPCQGDSGGPMICNNLQYGVCSHGYPLIGLNQDCNYNATQSVYMFINYYEKWLKEIMGSKKKKKRSSGNLLKPHHYLLHIILTVLLCNILTFILN
ncbi:mast cell protease 2-like isoform X1 [Acyrthosiphon pisum]|uniref:Peptidase S1 domain-containing protein n=2 Tax=Acyrthosiphon pisum TaxID=7029 RepID=A0A8R2B2A7_ACYPI|nr:mast cell protease 2-like isoform X1 [Acyrthosiphon pisum]|eukprot:XP_008179025.1 PREDICTED: mast cell protease 2-like isoform X1 [Acyrthosiphon pisum]